MPLLKEDETLQLAIRVPKKLHDQLDRIKNRARDLDVKYDPAPAIVRALEKDMDGATKQLDELSRARLTPSVEGASE